MDQEDPATPTPSASDPDPDLDRIAAELAEVEAALDRLASEAPGDGQRSPGPA